MLSQKCCILKNWGKPTKMQILLSLKGGIWLKMTQHAHQKYFKNFFED